MTMATPLQSMSAAPPPKAGESYLSRVESRSSSAFLRRISVNRGGGDSIRWGWSRSETERLTKMQALARGWLVRKKVCRIPARDVEAVLKDLYQKDKGLRRLIKFLIFMMLFYLIVILEADVTFQYNVERSFRDLIQSVSTPPSGMMLDDVMTRDDFKAWAVAFYFAVYHGTEVEDVCNTCAAARSDNVDWFFSDENISSLWGTTFPGVAGKNDSVVFEFQSCPLCYGSDAESIKAASDAGATLCDEICAGMEYCFEDPCDEYDELMALAGEVRGTNASQVKVFSSEDCATTINNGTFLNDYGARVGITTAWLKFAETSFDPEGAGTLDPDGGGYVATRNRVVGAVWYGWTYFATTDCPDEELSSFYIPCYADTTSTEDRVDQIRASLLNPQASVIADSEGNGGDGKEYKVIIDSGSYNSGLNMNACSLFGIVDSEDIMSDDLRSMTIRFNTYNGHGDGLFSTIDISAKFSLGGEVQVSASVDVFPLPEFTRGKYFTLAVRNSAIVVFAVCLACYIVKDVRYLLRELKDGRRHLSWTCTRSPITTVTLLNIWSDTLFVMNVVSWIRIAILSSTFTLNGTLTNTNALSQARDLSENLELVGARRWEQRTLIVIAGVLGLVRLFLQLRFHPRLSLVTDVLAASMVHLVHFFMMFFMVVAIYTNLVWVIFGPSNDLFATWTASFVTMTRAALGEFDNIYPQMVEVNPEASFLLIFTYQTLQFLLLLNIVISILLDAFQGVQERHKTEGSDTLAETVMSTFGRWRIRITNWLCRLVGMNRGVDQVRPYTPAVINAVHLSLANRVRKSYQEGRAPKTSSKISSAKQPGSKASSLGLPARFVLDPLAESRRRAVRLGDSEELLAADSGDASGRSGGGGGGAGGGAWSSSGTAWQGLSSEGPGLTRGRRVKASYRHYDVSAAAEILRRSPLPENAVWRKMRQIVGARLGWADFESGSSTSRSVGRKSSSARLSGAWSSSLRSTSMRSASVRSASTRTESMISRVDPTLGSGATSARHKLSWRRSMR